ncbi:phasin family protein [Raoultibacter massiliensis]|uniref:phasin family protein n=1 Tax=Raoultibacter massiliensis TaxID=1852371 RepID=UPI003A91B64C
MANLGDGFKDIFLAGVGAMAITGEKAQDLIGQLIEKGEITVDQGKQINSELKHKAEDVAATLRYDALEARMAVMTPEERTAFAARAAELAAKANAESAAQDAAAEDASEASAADTSSETAKAAGNASEADGDASAPTA